MLIDDDEATSEALKRAKEDYLNNPVSSGSKENPPFKIPKEKRKTKKRDNEDDNIPKASSRKNLYTRSEEKKILKWIRKNKRHSDTKGIKMWRELAESNKVPGRTCQSMKERFRKHILPKIQDFKLKKAQVDLFTSHR